MADRRSMMRANIGIQIAGSIGRPIPRGYVGIRRRLGQATPRAASMLAAAGFKCDGLLLLAYPLHPPGKPDQLRDAHLAAIKVPVICFNGTRDPFCTPSLMEEVLKRVTTDWEMHWVEGADHGFHVLKSSGKPDAQVVDEIANASQDWIRRVARN